VTTMAKKQITHICLKQIRSLIGKPEHQRLAVKGLGLRRIGHEVKVKDTPAIRGMVEKVQHLVEVEVRIGDVPAFGLRSKTK